MKGVAQRIVASLSLLYPYIACGGTPIVEQTDALLAQHAQFSGVVAIAKHGEVLYHRGFGQRDFDAGAPMEPDDIFELASVSKQFTAMAVMLLQQEGKLSYDDPLQKFMPELPYPGVTLRHMLHHTSGLPDYEPVVEKYGDRSKVLDNDDIIAYMAAHPPQMKFAPGTRYQYSNCGYLLLASIVEKVAHRDFKTFLANRIFKPLHMTHTRIRSANEQRATKNFVRAFTRAEGSTQYVSVSSQPQNDFFRWIERRVGPGRVSSNVEDLLKWDAALYTDKLISRSALQQAFTPGRLNDGSEVLYGFGWRLEQHPVLGRLVRHSGSNPGYKTHIMRALDNGIVVIVLCNNNYNLDELLKALDAIAASLAAPREEPSLAKLAE